MKKLFRKNEAVSFKNKKEKEQLLNIALEYGFKWRDGKELFNYELPLHANTIIFDSKHKKIGWALTKYIEKNTPANKFIKRFEEGGKLNFPKEGEKLKEAVFELTNKVVSLHEDNLTFKKQIGKYLEFNLKEVNKREKFKKLEKRVDAIAMEVVTLKNKENDPLVNIDFNELSFEEAHKQAYESICKHYGITDTEVKGVTFNQQPKDESVELRYTKGWYRSTKEGNLALLYFDGKDFLYGFNYKGEWEDEAHVCQDRKYEVIEEGTVILERESVIKQRLIEEAKRRGFLTKGTKFKSIVKGEEGAERIVSNYIMSDNTKKQITLSIDEDCDNILRYNNGILTHDGSKRLGCSNPYIYRDGKWAEVIASGSDLKYGEEVHTEAEFLEACGYVEEKIEYTLENIQVDCRGLSKYDIENICNLLLNKNKSYYQSKDFALGRTFDCDYLICNGDVFYITNELKDKHTITYEKFMELFSEKPIEELHAEHKEAKREPKVGDVVKAWDNNKDKFVYGILNNINYLNIYVYTVGDTCYKNIEQVTEININDFKREEN